MRELSASEITAEVLLKLRAIGYTVWRQNNLAVRGRKHNGRKGVSDVIGHTSKGLFVGCEVKTLKDVLSQDQKDFLKGVKQSGGIALVATQEKQEVVIKPFEEKEKTI